METIETALHLNFTSGEGRDLSQLDFLFKIMELLNDPSKKLTSLLKVPVEGWSQSIVEGWSQFKFPREQIKLKPAG